MDREARNALVRAHQNNINRYCRLLATHLTDVEREYVHRRIVEERLELEKLLKPPQGRKSPARAAGMARADQLEQGAAF
jgi:hypothetical protein